VEGIIMLKEQSWLTDADNLRTELLQSRDEGKDISAFEGRVDEIVKMPKDKPEREADAEVVFAEIEKLPVAKGYKYVEPSDIEGIRNERPASGKGLKLGINRPDENTLLDKVYGGWLGRCAGCLLGQPIEGWHRSRIAGLLKDTANYPFRYYISSAIPDELRQKYGIVDKARVYGGNLKNWINNVKYMPEDDDTNYTVIGLKLLEEYGPDFTPDDVAECWLANLPILHVCTAERVAYKNLVNRVYPPRSASFKNPYREWIGAQIRADLFGYAAPGNPELAAEMAWRDAAISHVKNGIYGEMFIAAMLSAAAVTSDIEEIIKLGLSQIPEKSRLAEEIRWVLGWKSEGINWEEAIDRIHGKFDEKNSHDWCHTISNALIVCVGLIFGELDFEKSIGIAVLGALDTDCNGATVGSIMGMILGAKALPEKWIKPLNDQLKSGVDGFGLEKISDMAARTVKVIKGIQGLK
jgi:ADP-ribosylglycohydrolase